MKSKTDAVPVNTISNNHHQPSSKITTTIVSRKEKNSNHHRHHQSHYSSSEHHHPNLNFSTKNHPFSSPSLKPNLYKLSLQLTTELDIRKWWDNVIEIFTSSYCATRILLSVPHDLTDTTNTPWALDTPCLVDLEEGQYNKIEQQQLSPWSQSPIKKKYVADKNLNPFFLSLPEIDDDSFNPPSSSPHFSSSYSTSDTSNISDSSNISNSSNSSNASNTSNTDLFSNFQSSFNSITNNNCSIVHIPLIHPTTVKNVASTNANHAPVPIAILSFLSYTVPYPQELLKSLKVLAPFLATTLSVSMIYQQSEKSSYITSISSNNSNRERERRRRDSQRSQRREYSTSSTNSSRWDYSAVFSINGRSPVDNEYTSITDGLPYVDYTIPSTSQKPLKKDRSSLPADFHKRRRSRRTCECTWVNVRLLKYTNRHIDDLLGHGWIDVVHPDDRQRVWEMWDKTFTRGEGASSEYRMRRYDGQYRWFLGRAGPLRDARGVNIRWFGTCTDVHDQKMAEQIQSRQHHIEANEKKYRLLAEAIPQIVFTATLKDGILYVNNKWLSYSGQNEEQAKGLGFILHVHPDDRYRCRLPEEKEGGTSAEMSYTTEVRLMRSDGEHRWFLVKCISVEDYAHGRKWFGTCTDINDHKIVEQKLKEAHDAAKRSTESKTRFLSNMSHEIRTPLIGITGMINFMLATTLTVEQLDYAHTIQQSADALLLVINDILDLSKVEAGMMKLEMEPFSVHNMIEDANELLSTLAIQKGLELSFIVEDNVPEVICGDRIRLRQVLLNVIGNAIKFTSKGEVFSRCSLYSTQQADTCENEIKLLFEVVDTGDGFDSDEEAVMFKPFSQVDTSSTRKHGGSGLGLVISRQLIELHGGEMFCKSKKGFGSTFYFSAKFSVPPDSTTPRPPTPTSEVCNSPFFRVEIFEPNSNDNSQIFQTNRTSSNNSSRPSTPLFKNRKPLQIDLPRTVCVLIVAELPRARETLIHYVRSILPKIPPPAIDICYDYNEATNRINATPLKSYTHIFLNLASQPQIISLASIIKHAMHLSLTVTVILTTPIQRAGIVEGAQNDLPERVEFIFKPSNRSKMEGLFDVTTTVRDNFLKRRNTHKIAANQKEVFKRMADDVGNRGFRVLLVEDNFVNQKVMTQYLTKVGLDVEIANNGEECLEKFYSYPHNYYSLILCDLFMPVKDGYETTAEIRAWEAKNLTDEVPVPIIALSANVMSDVSSRCLEVGFTNYISKPVNFATLSDVIRDLLLIKGG
ncbi:10644_t:CDS:10 [Diversispora eburnea]|uniref:10644_t:CDS:1 n=1 Tax=Diversispora eburnea TaxID=1213867 RepID=A0A9N9ACP2_9GLOM|nr:10644_t:CDS:10 [Diversispora eburnea]